MKSAPLNQIKSELKHLDHQQLFEICLKLSKSSTLSKEYLTYLLFYADDESGFVEDCKNEINEQFETVHVTNVYLAKKSIRKALKLVLKFSKFSKSKETEITLRIHFCIMLKNVGIRLKAYPVLDNLYLKQIEKIQSLVATLHEDVQIDYEDQLMSLTKYH